MVWGNEVAEMGRGKRQLCRNWLCILSADRLVCLVGKKLAQVVAVLRCLTAQTRETCGSIPAAWSVVLVVRAGSEDYGP